MERGLVPARFTVRGIHLVLAVLIVSLAALAGVESPPAPAAVVEVGPFCPGYQLSASVTYLGAAHDYLTYVPPIVPANCVVTSQPPGAAISVSLYLRNTDANATHAIQSVTIPPPFRLLSISPVPPIMIPPEGWPSFSLNVSLPAAPGTYAAPVAAVTTA